MEVPDCACRASPQHVSAVSGANPDLPLHGVIIGLMRVGDCEQASGRCKSAVPHKPGILTEHIPNVSPGGFYVLPLCPTRQDVESKTRPQQARFLPTTFPFSDNAITTIYLCQLGENMNCSEKINALSNERQFIWRKLAKPGRSKRDKEADVLRLQVIKAKLKQLWHEARIQASGAPAYDYPHGSLSTYLDQWPVADVLEPERVKPVRDFLLGHRRATPRPLVVLNPHSIGLRELHRQQGKTLVWERGGRPPVLREI